MSINTLISEKALMTVKDNPADCCVCFTNGIVYDHNNTHEDGVCRICLTHILNIDPRCPQCRVEITDKKKFAYYMPFTCQTQAKISDLFKKDPKPDSDGNSNGDLFTSGASAPSGSTTIVA